MCITSYKQLFKGHPAFMKMRWKYLIVDEMQQIKNMTEKHWEALFSLRWYGIEHFFHIGSGLFFFFFLHATSVFCSKEKSKNTPVCPNYCTFYQHLPIEVTVLETVRIQRRARDLLVNCNTRTPLC